MHDYFDLNINSTPEKTFLTMKLFTNVVNTHDIPYTLPILEKFLPSIFTSTCYNDSKLPFYKEVKNTEIGHLFEHILLEYLCKLKLSCGFLKVEFSGETCWNWIKYPTGTFHITINAGNEIKDILLPAIHESTSLLNAILDTCPIRKNFPTHQQILTPINPLFPFSIDKQV